LGKKNSLNKTVWGKGGRHAPNESELRWLLSPETAMAAARIRRREEPGFPGVKGKTMRGFTRENVIAWELEVGAFYSRGHEIQWRRPWGDSGRDSWGKRLK